MEEDSRRTKDRRFIVELRDRAINKILLLYVKTKTKSSALGMKESSGEERGSFLSLYHGRVVELIPKIYLVYVVIRRYKEKKSNLKSSF